jgi:murein DD-endopeptidase MepM/ murein hydrolase activator NlpD
MVIGSTSASGLLRTALVLALALSSGGVASAARKAKRVPAATARGWSVRLQPENVVNGAPLLVMVRPPVKVDALTGKWLDHDLAFEFDPDSKSWFALGGVGFKTKPGKYQLELSGTAGKGEALQYRHSLLVRRGTYRTVALTVPDKYVEPPPQEVQRIQQEAELKKRIFARPATAREWEGTFNPPVQAAASDSFGTQRKFNGKVASVHQGTDFAVPTGTPVTAINSGTVILARDLYFEGNCVMIDHGQGFTTLYMHLSEIQVREGDHIERGQMLGLSGGTGRATGPHLHLAVRWQGEYLNPAILLKLRPPAVVTPVEASAKR